MGLRQTGSQISMSGPVSLVGPDHQNHAFATTNWVPLAVSYSTQDWRKAGPNGNWQSHLSSLVRTPPKNPAPTALASEPARAIAMSERASRRAFEGAPPVIPHPVIQDSSAACLACHGPGLAVKDKVAAKISHPHFANCTQCHVTAGGPGFKPSTTQLTDPIAANRFVPPPAPVARAKPWPQAPPTIPHSTFMRGDCLSCHGPLGHVGLRTQHPERFSCMQCHVADAKWDLHSFSTSANRGWIETTDSRITAGVAFTK